MKPLILGPFALLIGVLSSLIISAPAHAASMECRNKYLQVTLSETNPTKYKVFGKLCWKGTLSDRKTVQLLTHGGSYDHQYWDFPYQPATYSYVMGAVNKGYATFAIDRVGTGLSDKPPAEQVTMPAHAFVNHQIVQALRAGTFDGVAFRKVLAVGHSFGGGISILEAGSYSDVDGVVVTGFLHDLNPEAIPGLISDSYPAQLDPKFMNAGLPLGYLTTKPGARSKYFYNTAFADPKVIALDEELKQTITDGELSTLGTMFDRNVSQQIQVPVLLVVGQKDYLMCNEFVGLSCMNKDAVLAREQNAYSMPAKLEAYVQPTAGHSNALHPNAWQGYNAMFDWASRNGF
ncbi:MAG: alpha/beta hydrolase [Candidatus Saccharimonadales bacterium]